MTLPPGGGKPGHIRETLKLHPHSHFLDASKERSLTAALKNKERSKTGLKRDKALEHKTLGFFILANLLRYYKKLR